MATDPSSLAIWQAGCYTDLVRVWRVTHPADGSDDLISLNEDQVMCQFLFADNTGTPTDVGRMRAFTIRRATTCNLTADTELGPDWFIQDITPQRDAADRYVYRVQEAPAVYPSQGIFDMNLKIAMVEHDPHPPEEIV
jgi:hypothetical protein